MAQCSFEHYKPPSNSSKTWVDWTTIESLRETAPYSLANQFRSSEISLAGKRMTTLAPLPAV